MRNRSLFVALILFTLIAVFGCDPYKRLDEQAKLMVGADEGYLRGVWFDWTKDQVMATETAPLTEEYSDYLVYTVTEGVDTGYIEVEYMFNEQGQLDRIGAYYYTSDSVLTQQLTDQIRKYFDRKFGSYTEDEYGWWGWEFRTDEGEPGEIEVSLMAEYDDNPYAGVELLIDKYYDYNTVTNLGKEQ